MMDHRCSTEFWTFQGQGSLDSSREMEPEKAARESMFPRCYALSWLRLYLAFVPRKKREVIGSEGGMVGPSQTHDRL